MTEQTGTEIVNPSAKNFFEKYGEQTSSRNIVGKLLKFSKGDFLCGQENDEVPIGTKFTVSMDNFLIGWIKWVDQRPEEQIMGLLSEGHVPQKRRELGDLDEATWEVDEDGQARDPWQMTNQVLFKEPGKKRSDDVLYTFTTSSYGGISNLGKLCKAYGGAMAQHPDENPVVEIGVEKYKHPNSKYGMIKNPTFAIVGWEKKALFADTSAEPARAAISAPAKAKKK